MNWIVGPTNCSSGLDDNPDMWWCRVEFASIILGGIYWCDSSGVLCKDLCVIYSKPPADK